ncbi:MAG: YdcH family protein [Hyphomicrobiaceae bacterium]
MAASAHLSELAERHRVLEKKIEEALMHPSIDTLEITELKREKLKLKDAMARMKSGLSRH